MRKEDEMRKIGIGWVYHPTEKQLAYALDFSKREFRHTHKNWTSSDKPESKRIGALGEAVFGDAFGKKVQKHDNVNLKCYDNILGKFRVDVKVCTHFGPPLRRYKNAIRVEHMEHPQVLLVFCYYDKRSGDMWIVGWGTKNLVRAKGRFAPIGTPLMDCDILASTDLWEIKLGNENPIGVLRYMCESCSLEAIQWWEESAVREQIKEGGNDEVARYEEEKGSVGAEDGIYGGVRDGREVRNVGGGRGAGPEQCCLEI
jgi:hypothetical protein